MISRRAFVVGGGLLALARRAGAQAPGGVPYVGYVGGSAGLGALNFEAFRDGLRSLGYTPGQSIEIEWILRSPSRQ